MRIAHIMAATVAFLLFAAPAVAGMTTCRMTYTLKGWSFIYKQYKGTGTVTCANGESAAVKIVTRGGGLTAGKSEIDRGKGSFTEVKNIDEVFGTYASANAGAGATRSGEGWAMTKGEISLALAGTGRGFDLGVSFGSFTIQRQ
jgi:hypothetical protein